MTQTGQTADKAPLLSPLLAGSLMVGAAALIWSFGGVLARIADPGNPWIVIFWRSVFAATFLIVFLLARDGLRGSMKLFAAMGWPGLGVAGCFGLASSLFVVALEFTSVANALLMLAGAPLIAAFMSFALFGEKLAWQTLAAALAAIAGVGVMMSDSFTGEVSPIGDLLALAIAFAFACAAVITRRHSHIRMTPAVLLGAMAAGSAALVMSLATGAQFLLPAVNFAAVLVFGLSLGAGMVLFVTGARQIQAAFAALIGMLETVLGPVWPWQFLGETPAANTLIGGGMVLAALAVYFVWQLGGRQRDTTLVPPAN